MDWHPPHQTSLKPFNFKSTILPHSPLLSSSHSVDSHNRGVQHWWNDTDSKQPQYNWQYYRSDCIGVKNHMQELTFTISTTASTPPAVMPQLERSTLCMLVSNLIAWQTSWQPSSPIGLRCREMCWSDLQLCMPCNHTHRYGRQHFVNRSTAQSTASLTAAESQQRTTFPRAKDASLSTMAVCLRLFGTAEPLQSPTYTVNPSSILCKFGDPGPLMHNTWQHLHFK